MLRYIARRLFRDRRRYLLTGALLFMAGTITTWDLKSSDFGFLMPFVGGLAYAILIGAFAPILCLVIPPWRFLCETVALALLVMAVLGRVFPVFDMMSAKETNYLYFFLIGCVINTLYCGTWLDKWLQVKSMTFTSRHRTRLSAQVLFDGILGDPDRPEALHNATDIIAFQRISEGSETLRLIERIHPIGTIEELHHIEAEDAPYMRRFRWELVDAGPQAPFVGGGVSAEIEDHGKYRILTLKTSFAPYPARAAVLGWIDDAYGRIKDDQIASLERRGTTVPPEEQDALLVPTH